VIGVHATICQICKEPIWTFICPDCLARDIGRWLPQELSSDFLEFSRKLTGHFSRFFSGDWMPCIHCKDIKEASICTFCYVKEATEWLKERNDGFAEKLGAMMSLAAKTGGFHPITETRKDEVDEGICEMCGIFSNELLFREGRWVCRECEDLE